MLTRGDPAISGQVYPVRWLDGCQARVRKGVGCRPLSIGPEHARIQAPATSKLPANGSKGGSMDADRRRARGKPFAARDGAHDRIFGAFDPVLSDTRAA